MIGKVNYLVSECMIVSNLYMFAFVYSALVTGSLPDSRLEALTQDAVNAILGSSTSLHVDCHHHLRNVWNNAIEKAIDDHHRVELKEELKEIDSRLRVRVNTPAIARSQDELLSLTINFLEGDGGAFHAHMEEHHPDSLMIPVPSMKGNRQDVIM